MLREQTFEKLYKLKLHGMAQALEEQLKQPETASLSFEERLAVLVDAQWTWRENQGKANRPREARAKQRASIKDMKYPQTPQTAPAPEKRPASPAWAPQR